MEMFYRTLLYFVGISLYFVESRPHLKTSTAPQVGSQQTHVVDGLQRPQQSAFTVDYRTETINSSVNQCVRSIDDFPQFFTETQLEHGAILIAFLVGIYCFALLAIICDNYFLPCVERICETLNLSQDVAAATFMAIATSTPELFVNIVGTFITKSDIGIGTVVGSSLFNTLGVAALGGLSATTPIKLHWWPLTRDVIIYCLTITLLVGITWDGRIFWYEGLILFVVYFIYFTIMFQNVRIAKFAKLVMKALKKASGQVSDEKPPQPLSHKNTNGTIPQIQCKSAISIISHYGPCLDGKPVVDTKKDLITKDKGVETGLFHFPRESVSHKIFFWFSFPIRIVLYVFIPDPHKHPNAFPLTFLMCILFIGFNSYLVSWMITVIGNTFHIPDAILGLTFLAVGGGLPEAISITIMSRRGEGSMGVSNSLGANTMDILMSLGLPWFLKTIMMGTNNSAFIMIQSGSIEYTIISLIITTLILYISLCYNKFFLSQTVGIILLSVYVLCVVLAILSEMVFFKKKEQCNYM